MQRIYFLHSPFALLSFVL